MIARIWRGVTRAEDVDAYMEYLEKTGLAEYAATSGNRGVQVLCRRVQDRAEFVLLSFWDSLEAIQGFAGEDIERAVFYPEDDDYLIDRDLTVTHFEVLERSESLPAS